MGSLPHVVDDCFGIVQVFSDGSIFRSYKSLKFPEEVQDDGTAVWRDCVYDEERGLNLRIYKPRSPPPSAAGGGLPILFFFRGGGFCVGNRTWPNAHNCCLRLASALGVMVLAPDFRLAPEFRLPAAMEDSWRSVMWLKEQAIADDGAAEWLRGGKCWKISRV